jgi:integrase
MAKQLEKLSSLFIRRHTEPGWYSDGGNLYFRISPTGSKSFFFRYKVAGSVRGIGLGATHTTSLSEARDKARTMRQQLLDHIDPASARRELKAASRHTITFEDACAGYIQFKRHEWKSDKHAEQWISTLKTYCTHINRRSVADLRTADVLACLEPIWLTKTETANRLRQRIERVFDWAKTGGYLKGDNPAAWAGVLENLLPSPSKVATRANHASLPYARAPEFMAALRTHKGISASALEFLILTATRSGEVRQATWSEIDGDTWTIPSARMKAGVEHTVPLSKQARALLDQMPKLHGNDFIFASNQQGKCISDMSMTKLLRSMDWRNEDGKVIVAHGFRSTFRMWAAELTDAPREVAEHALAHKLPDQVEASYQRGTLFPKRVKLMQDWANFVN